MARSRIRIFRGTSLLAVAFAAAAANVAPADPAPAPLRTAQVVESRGVGAVAYDGVVQAVRQTVVAAQVSGAVVALAVNAGESVRQGQVLARLDARAAEQAAAAGEAQVQAARAAEDAATRELERQQQLFRKNYISQAALDRAEAAHKAARAQAAAQRAQAGATRTESGFYVVRAPYAGIVSEVGVVLGDMAMPGRALLTLYDPHAMRVVVPLPQSAAASLPADAAVEVELAGGARERIAPASRQLLPALDPATHSLELRLELPPGLAGTMPGQFARVWLPDPARGTRLFVPASALVRRAELDALYVVASDGNPVLRQVRLGRRDGDRVEVLAGVGAGERVALDPQAAARRR